MKWLVLSTEGVNIPHEVGDILLHDFREGHRSCTIFQVGRAILSRVSDVLALRRNETYKADGDIKKNAYIRDKETGKPNILYLKPVGQDLIDYFSWLDEQSIRSERLFPSSRDHSRHVTEGQSYKIMARTGDLLGTNYLGTHNIRKTGAYRIYAQTYYDVGLVISLPSHTSEAMTLKYLGLDQVDREKMFDEVKFD